MGNRQRVQEDGLAIGRHRAHSAWLVLSLCLVLSILAPTRRPAAAQGEAHASQATITRCQPESSQWTLEEQALVCIYVQDVEGLYGMDFELSLPGMVGIATIVDEDGATPEVQIARDYSWVPSSWDVLLNEANNSTGHVHYLAFGKKPAPEVNGSGPVACMRFQPTTTGLFNLTFTRHDLSDRLGFMIANAAHTCSVEFVHPTSVIITGFVAQSVGRAIHFQWETAQEVNILGFNLYYATRLDGPKIRLNSELIPTREPPGSMSGNLYSYEDWDVPVKRTYYWLELVNIYGRTEFYGPVSVKPLGR